MNRKTRPFLKWAGNKYRCLDYILPSLPSAQRLIEPFSGSAAVFMNTQFNRYLLAEVNHDLIHLFTILKKEGQNFINYARKFFHASNNEEKKYYDLREQFNQSDFLRLRAALFLYLNRHGYNGLCRYNQKGIYNVPFGRYSKPYFPETELMQFHEKSQHATFILSDFRNTFLKAQPGDVIYCDPPYAPLMQKSNFGAYAKKSFKEEDQIDLAHLAVETAKKGIPVLISNHDTEFTRHQYRHGQIISFSVRRNISCNPKQRIKVQELIAIFK